MATTGQVHGKSLKSNRLLKTELILSHVLRIGVIACASIIAFGVLLSWINASALHQFSAETLPALVAGKTVDAVEIPRTLSEFSSGLYALHPNVVIALGLILLILLPIIRVGLTVILFLIERDSAYLAITLFVFSVLISGMLLGKAL